MDETETRQPTSTPSDTLRAREALLEFASLLEPTIHRLRSGDVVFTAGERCTSIHILDAGLVRLTDANGKEAGFSFRGDWLGLEALVAGHHESTAEAMDYCVVWSLRIDSLLAAGLVEPRLVHVLADVIRQQGNGNACAGRSTASPERRIALFLLAWARALVRDGRDEQRLGLRVTRADLGSYLGLPLHAVDRGIGVLAQERALDRDHSRRHEIHLDDLQRLRNYAQSFRCATCACARPAPDAATTAPRSLGPASRSELDPPSGVQCQTSRPSLLSN